MECGCLDFGEIMSCDQVSLDLDLDYSGPVHVELISPLGRTIHEQTVVDDGPFVLDAVVNESMTYEMIIRAPFGSILTTTVDGLTYQCFRFRMIPVHVRI